MHLVILQTKDTFALPWDTTQLYQYHVIGTTVFHCCYRFFSHIKLNNPFVQIPVSLNHLRYVFMSFSTTLMCCVLIMVLPSEKIVAPWPRAQIGQTQEPSRSWETKSGTWKYSAYSHLTEKSFSLPWMTQDLPPHISLYTWYQTTDVHSPRR